MSETCVKLYALKTCDTCHKAIAWLNDRGVEPDIVDVRADGISRTAIADLTAKAGWETLLNRRSTTWRGLSDVAKTDLNADRAVDLMADHPTLIKRPVLVSGDTVVVGFDAAAKQRIEELLSGK